MAAQCGITNLALTLNKILVSHIQAMLPGLRMKIMAQIDKRSQEMKIYGDAPSLDTPMEQYPTCSDCQSSASEGQCC